MVSTTKLIKLARNWQKLAARSRKRISFPVVSSSSIAEKGHFVVYTADKERFVFPLTYLNNNIFRELFAMAEEEFGRPTDGPITPCNAAKDLEDALLTSISCRHFLSSSLEYL